MRIGTVTGSTSDMTIGNLTSQANTFDGLIDELYAKGALWTPAAAPTDYTIMQQISLLS